MSLFPSDAQLTIGFAQVADRLGERFTLRDRTAPCRGADDRSPARA